MRSFEPDILLYEAAFVDEALAILPDTAIDAMPVAVLPRKSLLVKFLSGMILFIFH
jgi:hypothetical protein